MLDVERRAHGAQHLDAPQPIRREVLCVHHRDDLRRHHHHVRDALALDGRDELVRDEPLLQHVGGAEEQPRHQRHERPVEHE